MKPYTFTEEERKRAIEVLMEDLGLVEPTDPTEPLKRDTLHVSRDTTEKEKPNR